jgi:ferric-dicitrate binding protein FerR (iron transport regulator)
MPTRKQRRRRAKEHRHEYVWEDAEGNELEPDEAPTRKPEADSSRRPSRPAAREPEAPSWRRTLRRAAIFAPVMFVVVMLLSGGLPLQDQLIQTAVIVAMFIPFSYFLDGLLWRSYKRRVERQANTGRRG